MMPRDDDYGGSDHQVDQLLRAAASRADSVDWGLDSTDVYRRHLGRVSPKARRRSVAAGLLVAALIAVVFVVPLPKLELFHSYSRPSNTVPNSLSVLTCPRTRLGSSVYWVPSRARGVDGRARLVPEATPSKVVICAYGGSKLARLAGRTLVTKGLRKLASELTWLPRPEVIGCAGVGLASSQGRDPVPAAYLVGLTYRQGWLWVATGYSGGCDGAGNGTFMTSADIGGQVKKAYETGRWVAPSYTSCAQSGPGRLGQEHAMVPAQPFSADICYFKAKDQLHETEAQVSRTGLSQLEGLLNGEPSFVSTNRCRQSASPSFYTVIFNYVVGPPVVVSVATGCVPAINNGSLQANDGTAAVGLIQRLLQR